MNTSDGAVTRWLRHASPVAFALYGGMAGFAAYSAMYAFRKPFTAAGYDHVAGWPFAVDFKVAIIIARVAGYAPSKIIGIKIVSEMPAARRAAAILTLVGEAVMLGGWAGERWMPAATGALFAPLLIRGRDNRAAVFCNLALTAIGFALLGLGTAAFQLHAIPPIAWMIVIGAGLYFAYTPFNSLLFDRFMATTPVAGDAGFLIYVADARGHVGSVGLLLFRNVGHVTLHWTGFLYGVCYVACALALIGIAIGAATLRRTLDAAEHALEPG